LLQLQKEQFKDTAATKPPAGAAHSPRQPFAPDKERHLPTQAKQRTQRWTGELELPHARTGNKGIVTQTEAQYLNRDSSPLGLVLISDELAWRQSWVSWI